MQKFTPEYLEAKRLKEKERQREYYLTVTKPKRQWILPNSQTIKKSDS